MHSVARPRFLARLRYQLLFGLLLAVALPTFIANRGDWNLTQASLNTMIGGAVAFIVGSYLFRRIASFPGVGIFGHVVPPLVLAYGSILVVFFGARLDYSRLSLFGGFVTAVVFFVVVSFYLRRRGNQRFYIVPSPSIEPILNITKVDWLVLREAVLPPDPRPVLIADLRADFEPQWERLIAEAAVAGHPVYHLKQVQESLTGRVEIEHLSENSFGSLLPNHSYLKIKRGLDFLTALAALPVLFVPMLIVAAMIMLDSPGPVFFRQKRRGHRGRTFEVVKFRTMRHGDSEDESVRDAAITKAEDDRITRVGKLLRRTRIDELPQIWNILKGEMSWIGPRPEALPLSDWYTAELPFYSYRHILRPGITGWAQVSQGHVTDLASVFEKLHYDFYYVKHFSGWLDLLILGKTIHTVFFGHGAK
jgi:lipopolysaccharide/colanic/teichoic acid biosynthesis glycosyltransferase